MRICRTWAAAALVAAACASPLSLPPGPGDASISGRIVREVPGTGRRLAVSGARVELAGTGRAVASAEDGSFRIPLLPPSNRRLLVRADLDADGVFESQRLVSGARLEAPGAIDLGEIVVASTSDVSGRVLLGDRLGVEAGHGGTAIFVPDTPFYALTGDNGAFVLAQLPAGTLSLVAMRAGYEPATFPTRELEGGSVVDLKPVVLAKSVAGTEPSWLAGRVVRPDGTPLAGAAVTVSDPSGAASATTLATASDGTFRFDPLAPGAWIVEVRTNGFGPALPGILPVPAGGRDAGDLALTAAEVPTIAVQPSSGSVLPGRPVADAGSDAVAEAGTRVTLDGSHSTGVRPLSFHWAQPDGEPTVTLDLNDSALAARPAFTAPDSRVLLHFTLIVTDGAGVVSAPDVVTVLSDTRPVAAAQAEPSVVLGGQQVHLVGSGSTDADGDALSGTWTALTDGAPAPASGLDSTLVAPMAAGKYEYVLSVSDGRLTSEAHATFEVTTGNVPPLAKAVAGTGEPGTTVALDATGSADPNGDVLTYLWEPQSGAPAPADAHAGRTTVVLPPSPGAFEYKLTVSDPAGLSASVFVEAKAAWSGPPVLVRQSPADGATLQSPGTVPTLEWSRALSAGEAGQSWLDVKDARGNEVPGLTSYADLPNGVHRVWFTPAAPLDPGTYTANAPALPDGTGWRTAPVGPWSFTVRTPAWSALDVPDFQVNGQDSQDGWGSLGLAVAPTAANGILWLSTRLWPFESSPTVCFGTSNSTSSSCVARLHYDEGAARWTLDGVRPNAGSSWGGISAVQLGAIRYETWMIDGGYFAPDAMRLERHPDGSTREGLTTAATFPAAGTDGTFPYLAASPGTGVRCCCDYLAPKWDEVHLGGFWDAAITSAPAVAPMQGFDCAARAAGISTVAGGEGELFVTVPVAEPTTKVYRLESFRRTASGFALLQGGSVPDGIQIASIGFGPGQSAYASGRLSVAARDGDGVSGRLRVRQWSIASAEWADLPDPAGPGAWPTSLLAAGANLYLAWTATVSGVTHAFAARWNGASWMLLRAGSPDGALNRDSTCSASPPGLALGDGTLYATWSEGVPANGRTVWQLRAAAFR